MNTLTITLCASTRTGCLSAPIPSCADERLTLAGDVTLSAGTSVALLTPRGDTLAHTILSEECAPGATITLSTLTAQAAEYTRSCRAGDTREALLAVGDSEHPLALIPARIAQNPLYTLAPPTDLAPAYPTTETLKSILAEMQAASNAAAQSATAARKSAEEAGESASSAASDRATAVYSATSAQAYAEDAKTAQGKAEAAKTAAEDAKSDAASSANAAAASEQKALAYKNAAEASVETAGSYRQQALDAAKKAEQLANTAATHALKASSSAINAANSATAAKNSAQEAAEGVTALLQGKVDAAEAANTAAEAAKTAAETAKTGAETAKAAAASSATSAADSATAAAKSATDLADAVATAESLDGRLSAIEPSALRAKDVYIGTMNNTQYADGAFSFNQFIETFWNYGTLYTGANFLAWCTGLKWALASHWDKIASNAFRECTSLTEIRGSVWRVPNMNNDSSEIGSYAFANCKNLEKMPPVSNEIKTLESGHWAGVRIIGYRAFYNCRKLPAQFVKDIISSPALWSIKNDAFKYCCLDSGGIDELVLGKNIVFNSYGAFANSGVKRVDCSQMVKDPMFNAQFMDSQLEEFILPQRQFSYYNGFSGLKYLRYVKMPPVAPTGSLPLFVKGNSFSEVDEVTVEFPITRAEAEAWTKYQVIVLDSFPLQKTVFNFTDEQGVTYDA